MRLREFLFLDGGHDPPSLFTETCSVCLFVVCRLKLTLIRGLGFSTVTDKNGRVQKVLIRKNANCQSLFTHTE